MKRRISRTYRGSSALFQVYRIIPVVREALDRYGGRGEGKEWRGGVSGTRPVSFNASPGESKLCRVRLDPR